jgi:CIC family chloride channel protein
VLIIIEMTGGYSLILPLMIANMTAYVVAHAWRPTPIYEALLEQDGINLPHDGALDDVPISHLIHHRGSSVQMFALGAGAGEVGRVTARTKQDVYPVVDRDGKLLGLITTEELQILSHEPELALLVNAADLMRSPASVRLEDDLRTALEAMISYGTRQLPVTDGDGRCVGLLDEADIVRAYVGTSGHSHRAEAVSLPDDGVDHHKRG